MRSVYASIVVSSRSLVVPASTVLVVPNTRRQHILVAGF